MKIRLKIGDRELTAQLLNNETAHDSGSLPPLTLTMFRREKFGHRPRAISAGGKRTHSYEVGQLIYWSPAVARRSLGSWKIMPCTAVLRKQDYRRVARVNFRVAPG
jgi:hypothetical protein